MTLEAASRISTTKKSFFSCVEDKNSLTSTAIKVQGHADKNCIVYHTTQSKHIFKLSGPSTTGRFNLNDDSCARAHNSCCDLSLAHKLWDLYFSAEQALPSTATLASARHPYGRILGFLDRSRYVFFQVAPQLHSRG
jgi:hypothetical protein